MFNTFQHSFERHAEICKDQNSVTNYDTDKKGTQLTRSDDQNPLQMNPYLYMFYTPARNDEEVHMPDCGDFIVYHIKRNNSLKASRLFQCHCQQVKNLNLKQRKTTQHKT